MPTATKAAPPAPVTPTVPLFSVDAILDEVPARVRSANEYDGLIARLIEAGKPAVKLTLTGDEARVKVLIRGFKRAADYAGYRGTWQTSESTDTATVGVLSIKARTSDDAATSGQSAAS